MDAAFERSLVDPWLTDFTWRAGADDRLIGLSTARRPSATLERRRAEPPALPRMLPRNTERACVHCICVYTVYIDMNSSFIISQADPRPMYLQLMEQICQRVATADWPAGHELPSIRVLAAEVRVSVITVKRAYLELERQGVIVTRQGKGSFVAEGADLGLRLREQELEDQLRSVASLSLLLGVPVEELTERLTSLREELTQEKS